MSRAASRCTAELSRARLRLLFFSLLLLAMLAGGHFGGACVALAGIGLATWSASVARGRGCSLAHTFATVDWLLLGLGLTLSGGAGGWLTVSMTLLVVAQLAPSERNTWPYLLTPVLLCAIVLGIADPSLGGSRALGLVRIAALVGLGVVIAARRRRPTPHKRAVTSVDATTGLYGRSRLPAVLTGLLEEAAAEHLPLSLVCIRLDHFGDTHDFYGEAGAEAIVRGVANRVRRTMGADDVAFRLRDDTIVVALKGRERREARGWASGLEHEVGARLVARHRQTVSTGLAAYPPVRTPEDLLGEALDALRAPEAPRLALAVAQ